jgi:hydroxymethylbilane synthase
VITTQGDQILDRTLPEIGGKGVFTQELDAALLSGTIDCAVHSLKDLPIENGAELVIGCIPARAEPRDALISARGYNLSSLQEGASVGTSSLRRSAQLLWARPGLLPKSLRGNVDTRVRKALAGEYDAIVLAGAGLVRLGLEKHTTEWLPLKVMLPAPGQGALAVQCRAADAAIIRLLAVLDDAAARKAVTAERSFLGGLGGGCAVPVAAYGFVEPSRLEAITLTGLVVSEDGQRQVRVSGTGREPERLGHELAERAAHQGAREILALGAIE